MKYSFFAALAGVTLLGSAAFAQTAPPPAPATTPPVDNATHLRVVLTVQAAPDEDDATARGRLYQAVAKECDTAAKAFNKSCTINNLTVRDMPVRRTMFSRGARGGDRPGPWQGMGGDRRGMMERWRDQRRGPDRMSLPDELALPGAAVTEIAFDGMRGDDMQGDGRDGPTAQRAHRLVGIVAMTLR